MNYIICLKFEVFWINARAVASDCKFFVSMYFNSITSIIIVRQMYTKCSWTPLRCVQDAMATRNENDVQFSIQFWGIDTIMKHFGMILIIFQHDCIPNASNGIYVDVNVRYWIVNIFLDSSWTGIKVQNMYSNWVVANDLEKVTIWYLYRRISAQPLIWFVACEKVSKYFLTKLARATIVPVIRYVDPVSLFSFR